MLDLLFNGVNAWFGVPAAFGTLLFIIRLGLMLLGGHGGDMHHDVATGDHHDGHTDAAKYLSVQTVTAFIMGFGWGGLAAFRGSDLSLGLSILVGVGCGSALFALMAWLMTAMIKMQSSGNVDMAKALGAEGDVYVEVPPQASRGKAFGKVRLVFGERQRMVNAMSEAETLPSNTRVRVVRVNPDRSVVVARA